MLRQLKNVKNAYSELGHLRDKARAAGLDGMVTYEDARRNATAHSSRKTGSRAVARVPQRSGPTSRVRTARAACSRSAGAERDRPELERRREDADRDGVRAVLARRCAS